MKTFFQQRQDQEPVGQIPSQERMEIWKPMAQGTHHDLVVLLPKAFLNPDTLKDVEFSQISACAYVGGWDETCMSIATRVGEYVVRHQFPARIQRLPEEHAKMFSQPFSGELDLRPAEKCRLMKDETEETVSCADGQGAVEDFIKAISPSDSAFDLSVYGFLKDPLHHLTDYVQVRRKDAEGVVHTISLEVLDEPPASVVKE
jgi:hypothetical protein